MGKMKLRHYEVPIARDLSGFLAEGQVTPNAFCTNGPSVVSPTCAVGPTPTGIGSCSPTGTYAGTGGCNTGISPDTPWPTCRGGVSALEGCATGTYYK